MVYLKHFETFRNSDRCLCFPYAVGLCAIQTGCERCSLFVAGIFFQAHAAILLVLTLLLLEVWLQFGCVAAAQSALVLRVRGRQFWVRPVSLGPCL